MARRLSIIGSVAPVAVIGTGLLLAAGSSGNAQNTAFAISAAGAIAGVATASLGEIYSHRWVTTGMALRAGGLVVANVGLFLAYNNAIGDCTSSCHLQGRSLAIVLGGAAMYVGGMALDIHDAPGAARSWRARHAMVLAPTAIPSGSKSVAGVGLALRF